MRLYSLYNIIFIFVLCNKIEIGHAAQFSKFKTLDKDTNSLCTDNHIEWEIIAPNAEACAMRCYTHSQCLGAIYKVDEKICYGLYSGNSADPCATKTSGGVVFWKLPENIGVANNVGSKSGAEFAEFGDSRPHSERETCPSGWESISKWCYRFTAEEEEWQTASDVCKSYSELSHLAYVNTNEEYAAVSSWIQSIWDDEKMWLGGYRIDNTDKWTWADGVAITDDLNWADGEPDNEYPTDCLLFYSHLVDFGDRYCAFDYTGLCELDIYN